MNRAGLSRVELWVALLITVLAVWLHFTRLTHAGGLWRDEAGAAQVALMPSVHEITKVFQHEAFPLLFPFTVRAYTVFAGASATAFRLFGFLVGLGVIAALWINAKVINGAVPLLSLALLGFNASVIQWGDSLRGYGLATVLMLIAFALHWRVVIAPSIWVVALAAVTAICSVQTLYANAVTLLAIGTAAAAVAIRNKHWPRALLVLGMDGLAALSLIPYLRTIQQAKDWNVVITIPEFSFSLFWRKLSAALSSECRGICWVWVALVIGAVVVAVVVQFRSASSQERDRKDAGLYCLIALLVSVPAFFGFLRILRYPTEAWYYLPLMALIAVAVEGSLLTLSWQRLWTRVARILVAGAVVITCFIPTWKAVGLRQTNLDIVAARLNVDSGAGDMILVAPWYLGVSFQRYYTGHTPWMTLPPIHDHKVHRYDLLKSQMQSMNPMGPVLNAMTDVLKSGHRVWIVGSLAMFIPSEEVPPIFAPAPYEPFGWDQDAYVLSWNKQTLQFIHTHALNVHEVPVSADQSAAPYEVAQLLVLQGWQNGEQ
jgi:hypothetical protein